MDRRAFFRKGLHPLYLPIYDALCAELPECWQPYFGLRDFTEQNQLYAQGRTAPGAIVTNARGGESAHNYGCASDWAYYEDGKLSWPSVGSSLWTTFGLSVEKVGGDWGGGFPHPDCPHVQLGLTVPWARMLGIFTSGGMKAVNDFIPEHLR